VNPAPEVSLRHTRDQTRDIVYEITLRGEMGTLLSSAFPDHTIEAAGGRTRLTADVHDDTELLGLLDRLHCLHLHVEAMYEVGSAGFG
jgi:hypothetical protein